MLSGTSPGFLRLKEMLTYMMRLQGRNRIYDIQLKYQ